MSTYSKALNNEEWSKHYNLDNFNLVKKSIESGNVQIWAQELCNIIQKGESCLEIGCGTGISSLWLAKNGRNVTALDYTESSIALVNAVKKELDINLNLIQADATKPLPFEQNEFDVIFQSGLLEHFSTEEQINLLKSWKKHCKTMVSMIPNASSLPYRVGKQILEDSNKWEYGLEIPKHSLSKEFSEAGILVEKEYTIGTEWALKFLPKRHYIRKFFKKLTKAGFDLDNIMQGYLLVTIGKCYN